MEELQVKEPALTAKWMDLLLANSTFWLISAIRKKELTVEDLNDLLVFHDDISDEEKIQAEQDHDDYIASCFKGAFRTIKKTFEQREKKL